MAYTEIDDPSAYFQIALYTGTGNSQAITNTGNSDLQPDFTWIKQLLSSGYNHALFDAVRGATKVLQSNANVVERTLSDSLTAFGSDGFSLGADAHGTHGNTVNQNSKKYVAWQWKAGTSFTNDASATGIGSIDSSGSISATAGFSIIKWDGTDANGTVAHGLSVPKMIIFKTRGADESWIVYHSVLGNTKYLNLNNTNAISNATANMFNSTSPTSTTFSVGANSANKDTTMIAYCFADVKGYSKVSGSYVGNGNASGAFSFCGFKVGWVMIKRIDTGNSWLILDNKRIGFNPDNNYLLADTNDPDGTDNFVDFYSNGFKIMSADAAFNASGGTYIYMAFAEQPFVTSTGIPATAR